ncbi:MAG: pyruvate kinase [Candidatus Berkelbacteria bacterium]|nr:pyruvate kinase [Candidatus Berkelbacteria bacterium]
MINIFENKKIRPRKTKIICTIGPATKTEKILKKMIDEGMNIARFNFSHGSQQEFEAWAKIIRILAKKAKKKVEIIQDLQGPRVRVGKMNHEGRHVEIHHEAILSFGKNMRRNDIPILSDIEVLVKGGNTIMIDSGLIELKVKKVANERIFCKVIVGGPVFSGKGLNFPDTQTADSFTKKDEDDLAFGLKIGVDFVALSFVEEAKDITNLTEKIAGKAKVISKIERPQAIYNFQGILDVSDAVMIARGDLGIEIPIEKLPMLQKRILRRCKQSHKPGIVATDMMASMVTSPRPTRAEVLDVSNAVLDGASAVMLSNESAVGKYPVETLIMMRKIIEETETFLEHQELKSLL